jgi:hypothetical protein
VSVIGSSLRPDLADEERNRVCLDGERTHLVEVVNATAEPGGSYRRYFLPVPPEMRTAREADGWTFGFESPDDHVIAVS